MDLMSMERKYDLVASMTWGFIESVPSSVWLGGAMLHTDATWLKPLVESARRLCILARDYSQ